MRKLIPNITLSYINNIKIKELKSRYNNKEVSKLSSVRRFVFKYFQNLDRVLTELKRVNIIISAEKSYFYSANIKIISFVYNYKNKYPD